MQAIADQSQPMNYGHAPITEAVIHFVTSTAVREAERGKVARRLKALYPNSHPLQSFSINISATGGPNVSVGPQPESLFSLASDDQASGVIATIHLQ